VSWNSSDHDWVEKERLERKAVHATHAEGDSSARLVEDMYTPSIPRSSVSLPESRFTRLPARMLAHPHEQTTLRNFLIENRSFSSPATRRYPRHQTRDASPFEETPRIGSASTCVFPNQRS
jgi:hypothetical protein